MQCKADVTDARGPSWVIEGAALFSHLRKKKKVNWSPSLKQKLKQKELFDVYTGKIKIYIYISFCDSSVGIKTKNVSRKKKKKRHLQGSLQTNKSPKQGLGKKKKENVRQVHILYYASQQNGTGCLP